MTTHRHALIAAIAAIVCTHGCQVAEPPRQEPPREALIGEAQSALAAVCPGTRMIGRVQPGGTCPPPVNGSKWVRQRLFDGLADPLPPELAQFCLYAWNGDDTPDHGKLPTYQNQPANVWLDPDCMAVAGMTPTSFATARAAITPELEERFYSQIEQPTLPPAPTNSVGVRVAVVDAWPSVGKVGTFEHGFGMGAIARRVACGGASSAPCFLTPVPHLALDLIEPDVRNIVDGGFFGYQSRLARAISEAVFAHAPFAQQEKLVINLSVGWDDRYNTRPDSTTSEAVLAVRAALEHAACAGALVIAAAGNAGSGPAPGDGPVLPAAWEQTPAPSCAGPVTRPLVYSVGGLNYRDEPIGTTRPGALPKLGAPSFMVPGVMANGASTAITGPYTGSSVAAAITSGIAASVWHRSPGLRPDQVMGFIGAGTVGTPLPADYCLSGACGNVGRVSHCRALEASLSTTLTCTKIPFGTGLNPILSPADKTTILGMSVGDYDGTNITVPNAPPVCSTPLFIPEGFTTYPDPWPCPSEMLPNAITTPTVGPQPPPNPCPACSLIFKVGEPSILVLIINERVSHVVPHVLSLNDRGGVYQRYDLTGAYDAGSGYHLVDGLSGGEVYTVEMELDAEYGVDFTYATIEWMSTPDAQTTSYLMIQR